MKSFCEPHYCRGQGFLQRAENLATADVLAILRIEESHQ